MEKRECAIELAAKLLKIKKAEATEYCYYIEEIDAYYFSVPIKGGDSIIISGNDEVLYANSSVGFDEHVNAFKEGIRTPLDAFDYFEE